MSITPESFDDVKDRRFEILDILKQYYRGDISLEDIFNLSDTEQFFYLRRLRITRLIEKLPGWSRQSSKRALSSFGIHPNVTLRTVRGNPRYLSDVKHIMSSSPTTYQQRVPAPDGWPWFGNIIEVLSQLDDRNMPREVSEASRFLLDDEKQGVTHAASPYMTYEGVSGEPGVSEAEAQGVATPVAPEEDSDEADDLLDDLFNDDVDTEHDDGDADDLLDEIFG